MKKITQKLVLLTVMLTGLVGLTVGNSTPTSKNALPCCSVCDENPDLRICRHGCSPSC